MGKSETKKEKRSSSGKTKQWVFLVLELFVVSFGVLLGFFINEWRGEIKEQKAVVHAMEQINKEIYKNYDELSHSIAAQSEIMPKLERIEKTLALLAKEKKSMANIDFGGFSVVGISTVAWEVSKEQNITASIDFEQVAALTTIYENANILDAIKKQIISQLYSPEFTAPEHLKPMFTMVTVLSAEYINFMKNMKEESRNYLLKYAPETLPDSLRVEPKKI